MSESRISGPSRTDDPPNRLSIWFEDHDIRLVGVAANAYGFAGYGRAWLGDDQLLDFAERLSAYPLSDDPAPTLVGGHFGEGNIRLEARRAGPRGQLVIGIHLATSSMVTDFRGDATFDLLTTYENVRRFADELRRLVRGELEESRLDGEELY